jgi:hypothetical protein
MPQKEIRDGGQSRHPGANSLTRGYPCNAPCLQGPVIPRKAVSGNRVEQWGPSGSTSPSRRPTLRTLRGKDAGRAISHHIPSQDGRHWAPASRSLLAAIGLKEDNLIITSASELIGLSNQPLPRLPLFSAAPFLGAKRSGCPGCTKYRVPTTPAPALLG